MINTATYHIPVLLESCIEGLSMQADGTYVDLTFGGGGHSKAIFSRLSSKGKLIAFDQDKDALRNVWEAPNFHFVQSNFAFLKNQLGILKVLPVDGILADLGVSSHQFDTDARGFSIRMNSKLDMRMNQLSSKTAFEVVNQYDEEKLYFIFRNYGEIDHLKKVVETILKARSTQLIETTSQLLDLLRPFAPRKKESKFYAQIFQAIRIEVNDEMKVLENMLLQAAEVLKPGGRLVVMSYHSLEDRLVKNFLKRGDFSGKIEKDFYGNIQRPFDEINRKPIVPTDNEIENNPRSRSAKLRIASKRE
jgi:16S rRNA (cytosine1402-N4)-methyltransferase